MIWMQKLAPALQFLPDDSFTDKKNEKNPLVEKSGFLFRITILDWKKKDWKGERTTLIFLFLWRNQDTYEKTMTVFYYMHTTTIFLECSNNSWIFLWKTCARISDWSRDCINDFLMYEEKEEQKFVLSFVCLWWHQPPLLCFPPCYCLLTNFFHSSYWALFYHFYLVPNCTFHYFPLLFFYLNLLIGIWFLN